MITLICGICITVWLALLATFMIYSGVDWHHAVGTMAMIWGAWAVGVLAIRAATR